LPGPSSSVQLASPLVPVCVVVWFSAKVLLFEFVMCSDMFVKLIFSLAEQLNMMLVSGRVLLTSVTKLAAGVFSETFGGVMSVQVMLKYGLSLAVP